MEVLCGKYFVKCKAMKGYLYFKDRSKLFINPRGKHYDTFDIFLLEDGKVKIKYSYYSGYYLKSKDNVLEMSKGNGDDFFYIILNDNGTYSFKNENGYYLTVNNDRNLYLDQYMENSNYQQFLLERVGHGFHIDVLDGNAFVRCIEGIENYI